MESERSDQQSLVLPPGGDQSIISLDETITALGRSFASHPGFMWTHDGWEVIHADWPAYPRGHGIRITLAALGEYPRDTRFFPIDNIDQCTLFVVGDKPEQDPSGPQHLHVAVWDVDLRASALARYIEGVRGEEDYLTFPERFMQLTPKGVNAATTNALLGQALDVLADDIIDHLHEARYDTAVREASLRVEIALRSASGLSDYGRRLVEKCFGERGVLIPEGLTNPNRQLLRNAFQGYFKYVRNEYMHSLPPVDMLTACTLVRRSAALLTVIQGMDRTRASRR
jgi:hypothetical protein